MFVSNRVKNVIQTLSFLFSDFQSYVLYVHYIQALQQHYAHLNSMTQSINSITHTEDSVTIVYKCDDQPVLLCFLWVKFPFTVLKKS